MAAAAATRATVAAVTSFSQMTIPAASATAASSSIVELEMSTASVRRVSDSDLPCVSFYGVVVVIGEKNAY